MNNFKTHFMNQITPRKDVQTITNTCASQSSPHKNVMGKFFRKPDFGKIQRKKKQTTNQQTSLICYLNPKLYEDSNKLIKQRIKQCKSQVDIVSNVNQSTNNDFNLLKGTKRYDTKGIYQTSQNRSIETSLQKNNITQKQRNKIIINSSNKQKNSAQQEYLIKHGINKKSAVQKITQQNNSGPQTKQSQKIQLLKQKHQKQMQKLKNQCQYYSNLLQKNNCSTNQLNKKLKEIQKQLKQTKAKHQKQIEQKERELKDVNNKVKNLESLNNRIREENKEKQEVVSKKQSQINYLKITIQQLNERINEIEQNLLLKSSNISTPVLKGNKRFNSFTQNHVHNKDSGLRLSTLVDMNAIEQDFQDNLEDKQIIKRLKEELKYCQVGMNMLKKLKFDVNKQNKQFQKLQDINKSLKDQIFQLKNAAFIKDQLNKSRTKTNLMPRVSNPVRNNFQINLQLGHRKQNQKKSECSSDTLSLNLSLSPQKQRRRN